MTATTPIEIEGESFPYYQLQLAISGRLQPSGESDASVSMRLVPARITEEKQIVTADANSRAIVLGSLAQADAPTQTAIGAIRDAVQAFITTKGL